MAHGLEMARVLLVAPEGGQIAESDHDPEIETAIDLRSQRRHSAADFYLDDAGNHPQ